MASVEAAFLQSFTAQGASLPDVVRDSLDDWVQRPDVYRLWRQHFARSVPGPEEVGRNMVRWLLMWYNRYPMLECIERFRLFKVLADWLLSGRCPKGYYADCEAVIALQPMHDILRMSLVDVGVLGTWLDSKTGSSTWQASDENELLRLSYHPPDIIYENVLKALVVSTATRSDVYIAVLDAIEKFVMCVEGGRQKTDQAMLNKAQWLLDLTLSSIEEYPPTPLILPILYDRAMRSAKLGDLDPIGDSPDLALIRSVENSLLRLAGSLPDVSRHNDYAGQAQQFHIPMPAPSTFMRLVVEKEGEAFRGAWENGVGGEKPPSGANVADHISAKSRRSRALESWLDTDEFLLAIGGVGTNASTAMDDGGKGKRGSTRAGRTSLAYQPVGMIPTDIDVPLPRGTTLEDIMCVTQSVWLQVDPKPDRILLSARETAPPSNELLVSPVPGSLFFTLDSMQWMGPSLRIPIVHDEPLSPSSHSANIHPSMQNSDTGGSHQHQSLSEESSFERRNEPGLILEYSRISHFSFGQLFDDERKINMDDDEEYTQPTSRPVSARERPRTAGARSPPMYHDGGQDVPGGNGEVPHPYESGGKVSVTFDEPGNLVQDDSTLYYIVLHETETFKFFPFYENEVHQIMSLLTETTGLGPYNDADFVREVLSSRVDGARLSILRQLESQEHPWIERTPDLERLISSLIVENKPQSLLEMERLYHSCRLEREVTKEAIHMLRRSWLETHSEKVRLKIISILDRLLDRAVIHPRDPSFMRLMEWLRYAEKNLDPYKSAESLKNIVELIGRADDIKKQKLMPLNQTELPSMFDYWEQYKTYRQKDPQRLFK